jgi:hypothetical protein
VVSRAAAATYSGHRPGSAKEPDDEHLVHRHFTETASVQLTPSMTMPADWSPLAPGQGSDLALAAAKWSPLAMPGAIQARSSRSATCTIWTRARWLAASV